jgi:hypothetical protein
MRVTIYVSVHGAFPLLKIPLLVLVSTYLAPSSCDRNRPPRSQVACKLLPFVPHCSLVPSTPNSRPSLGFPEPNVHLIRRITNPFPSIQNTPIVVLLFLPLRQTILRLLLFITDFLHIHLRHSNSSSEFVWSTNVVC